MSIEIITGEDLDDPVFLVNTDGSVHPVNTSATVTAALRNKIGLKSPIQTMESTDPASDWPNGRLQFILTSAQTDVLDSARKSDGIHLEIKIVDPGGKERRVILRPEVLITIGQLP